MGCFTAEVELINPGDLLFRDHIDPDHVVRRATVPGWVDSGANLTIIPQSLADELGLPALSTRVDTRLADGQTIELGTASVLIEWFGRQVPTLAVVAPGLGREIIIGAVVLESLDLLVDCARQQVTPRAEHAIVGP
jgi:clan AA aspartic protease